MTKHDHARWVADALARLDSERLAGQMVGLGFEGHEPPSEIRRWLAEGRAGSVILFGRNIASPGQLAGLTAELLPFRAAVRALCGEVALRGRLPVSLPGLYPRGHGLQVGSP